MNAHVLHGAWVIVGGGRLLDAHHGRLLGEDSSGLSGRVGRWIVTAPVRCMWREYVCERERERKVCVCVCVCVGVLACEVVRSKLLKSNTKTQRRHYSDVTDDIRAKNHK